MKTGGDWKSYMIDKFHRCASIYIYHKSAVQQFIEQRLSPIVSLQPNPPGNCFGSAKKKLFIMGFINYDGPLVVF